MKVMNRFKHLWVLALALVASGELAYMSGSFYVYSLKIGIRAVMLDASCRMDHRPDVRWYLFCYIISFNIADNRYNLFPDFRFIDISKIILQDTQARKI